MKFKVSFFVVAFLFLACTVSGHEKKWPEKRLRQTWPEAQTFTSKQVSLTSGQISTLKGQGIQIGSQDRSPTFYFPEETREKKSVKLGVILFVDGTGANGVMEMSIAMGLDGRVKKVDIWEHSENAMITKDEFLNQFLGKGSADNLVIDKDYKPQPGAEKASESVGRAVVKALKIAKIVFEKN